MLLSSDVIMENSFEIFIAPKTIESYTSGKSKMKALFDNDNKFDDIQENLKELEPYLNSSNNINK